MSSKNTIFLSNDYNEHCYFDCSNQQEDNEGFIKDEITIEFDRKNIRIDAYHDSDLVISITNVDSDIYKIFEKLNLIVPKELK